MNSYADISADITSPRFDRAWRTQSGRAVASVRLGDVALTFTSAADARAVAAACTGASEALEALEADNGAGNVTPAGAM